MKDCHAKNARTGQRERSHPDCGSWFFPKDHEKGNSEHPHNRMLMHRDKCDHGRGGGWMGEEWGSCFQCRGGDRKLGWFVLEEVEASRERTHKFSNSGMMCQGFGRTRVCFFRRVQSESRPSQMILLHFLSLSFWWERRVVLVQTEVEGLKWSSLIRLHQRSGFFLAISMRWLWKWKFVRNSAEVRHSHSEQATHSHNTQSLSSFVLHLPKLGSDFCVRVCLRVGVCVCSTFLLHSLPFSALSLQVDVRPCNPLWCVSQCEGLQGSQRAAMLHSTLY